MRLVSLKIEGRSPSGWSSDTLYFGERVTQLFGKNGCGKTPLVQSIVYALGYKVDFRDELVAHCESVVLEVASDTRKFSIRRRFHGQFSVSVWEVDSAPVEFLNEREYSAFLLSLWGVEDPVVTTVGSVATHMYSAQILPIFYLDQDRGYSEDYFSASKFVKDQYSEVMRLLFGLSPKNPFDKRRERIGLKDRLEQLDRGVLRLQTSISDLGADLGAPRRSVDELDRELRQAIERLNALRESGGSTQELEVELDARIAALAARERELSRERAATEARIRGFSQIRNEIEVEADTLYMNEEARRVFASFDSICSKEGCGLFMRSSESYGKSLLYLKDQIKDLEATNRVHLRRIDSIDEELGSITQQLAALRAERSEAAGKSNVNSLVEAVAGLTEAVISLRRAKGIEEELTRVEALYVERLHERDSLQIRLSDLEGNRGAADLDALRVRNSLAERIKHWLVVLGTSNVDLQVQVDTDFGVTFGGQRISKFRGSTLTRVVLSIRTAAFDLLARKAGRLPRFLILDTPRQQDISREDLARYIAELQMLAGEWESQVVYSTTNHRYDLGEGDKEWQPRFPGENHDMFLGLDVN